MINLNTDASPQVPKTRGDNVGEMQDGPDKGMLSGATAEPNPSSDLNHRRKQATGELLAQNKKLVKDKATMTKMDATCMGENLGHVFHSLLSLPESQRANAGQAVVNHHFDDHTHCGPWCKHKSKMSAADKKSKDRHC